MLRTSISDVPKAFPVKFVHTRMQASAIAFAFSIGCSTAPQAQIIGPLIQEPDDVPGQRVIPEYAPIGYDLAGFDVLPTVAFGIKADDNVFTRTSVKRADVLVQAEPRLRLNREDRSSRFGLDASARITTYAQLSDQDTTEYKFQGTYTHGVKGTNTLAANLGYRKEAIQRGTVENDLVGGTPLMRGVLHGTVTGHWRFNRLSIDAQALTVIQRYRDIGDRSGNVIDQRFRNVQHIGIRTVAAYEISGRTSAFSSLEYDRFDYATSPLLANRDAVNWSGSAGVRYELNRILLAQFSVGYRKYDFREKALGVIGGLALSGHLRYFPSRLLAIRGSVEQSNTTSPYDLVGAVTLTTMRVESEYEMRRSLSWLGAAKFTNEDYGKQPYSARRVEISAGPRFRFNRWLSADATAGYAKRFVHGAAPFEPYSQCYAMISIRLAR